MQVMLVLFCSLLACRRMLLKDNHYQTEAIWQFYKIGSRQDFFLKQGKLNSNSYTGAVLPVLLGAENILMLKDSKWKIWWTTFKYYSNISFRKNVCAKPCQIIVTNPNQWIKDLHGGTGNFGIKSVKLFHANFGKISSQYCWQSSHYLRVKT